MEYTTNLSRIESLIAKQLPKIIKAANRSEATEVYNKTVKTMNSYGLDLIIQMNSEAYESNKQKLGLTNGWPAYQEGYVNPLDRTKPNGDETKYRGY